MPWLFLPAFALGVAASFYLPETWAALPVQGVAAAALGVLLLAAVCGRCLSRSAVFLYAATLAVLVSGAAYGVWRTQSALASQWQAAHEAQAVSLRVEVLGLPERDEAGRVRFIGMAHTPDGKRYRMLFQDYAGQSWQVGEQWLVNARVRAIIGMRNPAGFDRESWALANGIDAQASVGAGRRALAASSWLDGWRFNAQRARISAHWNRVAERYPLGAGLMQALAVGNRSGLDYAAWAAFRPLGIQHLISISGLHITMVAVLAAYLAKLPLRYLRRAPKRPRVWQMLWGAAAALLYTGLAGFEVPALRSLIMLSVFAWAWVRRGQIGSWRLWWTAVCLVLLYQPAAVLSVGFWLSFGLVGALIWYLGMRLPRAPLPEGYTERRFDALLTRSPKWHALWEGIKGQWAATLVGGVATIAFFGLLPVYSPLVNALAIPWFSWVLTPLALAASAISVQGLLLPAAAVGEYTMRLLLDLGAVLPEQAFAQAPNGLAFAALLCAFVLLLPRGLRIKPLACVGLALFACYQPAPPEPQRLRISVWDVGQGLSVLLQTENYRLLYDTGTAAGAEGALLPNLRAQGITHLHDLVLSHHDDDHDGGFDALQKAVRFDRLWAGQPEFYARAVHCRAGESWQADGVRFEWLTPTPHAKQDNERSCVLRVSAHGTALLITGDLGKAGEQVLLERYRPDELHSQLLVLGHHGSQHSSSSAFISAVAPQIGIASSGFANPFKHPHPQVQKILSANGVKLMRTDTQGALFFELAPEQNGSYFVRNLNRKKWWQRKPFDANQ